MFESAEVLVNKCLHSLSNNKWRRCLDKNSLWLGLVQAPPWLWLANGPVVSSCWSLMLSWRTFWFFYICFKCSKKAALKGQYRQCIRLPASMLHLWPFLMFIWRNDCFSSWFCFYTFVSLWVIWQQFAANLFQRWSRPSCLPPPVPPSSPLPSLSGDFKLYLRHKYLLLTDQLKRNHKFIISYFCLALQVWISHSHSNPSPSLCVPPPHPPLSLSVDIVLYIRAQLASSHLRRHGSLGSKVRGRRPCS